MLGAVDEFETQTVEFPSGSIRLREFSASRLRRYPARTCTAARLASLLEQAELPLWSSLFAFEDRVGGVALTSAELGGWTFGLCDWLAPLRGRENTAQTPDDGGKIWSTPALQFATYDNGAPIVAGVEAGRWMVCVGCRDIETYLYQDEAGWFFEGSHLTDRLVPRAVSLEGLFEKFALWQLVEEVFRAGRFSLEIAGEHGASIASVAGIPSISEASDGVSLHWWDGRTHVQTRFACGESEAITRVDCASAQTRSELELVARSIAGAKAVMVLA